MSNPAPIPLPENTGLAFLGETAWPAATLTTRQAEQFATAPNACGRPNSDVLRRRLTVVNGEPAESWQIDFPVHFTAQEAALYEQPFAYLRQHAPAWRNPHANPALRRALARVSRYLATPAESSSPEWQWIEDDLLPDASLLVVARDDDFTHGVLQSHAFALWWKQFAESPSRWSPISTSATGVGRDTDAHPKAMRVQTVASFPFPWPPATPLSALTAVQEDQRHNLARAARSDDAESLNAAVLAAYGWPANLDDGELLEKLAALNRKRVEHNEPTHPGALRHPS